MIVTLEIRTWTQVGNISSHHYYGVLKCPGQRPTRLEHIIDEVKAARLNGLDDTPGLNTAGMKSERFDSEAEVRALAQEVWAKLYPAATEMKEIPWTPNAH